MAWLYLSLAAIFEVAFAVSVKAAKGFTALGTVILGHVFFGESLSLIKIVSVAAIALGVVGLKIAAT